MTSSRPVAQADPGGAPADVDEIDEADEEIVEDDVEDEGPVTRAPWRGPSRRRWALFAVVAVAIVVLDQLTKAWVAARLPVVGQGFEVLGDWLRIVHWRNSGALFGLLPQSATAFAVVSLVVVVAIVVYHARAGRGIVVTLALALLLGGALGNLIDRLNYGSVLDFVDMGVGAWRFYTYNLADAAITTSIVALLAMALFPSVAEWGADG